MGQLERDVGAFGNRAGDVGGVAEGLTHLGGLVGGGGHFHMIRRCWGWSWCRSWGWLDWLDGNNDAILMSLLPCSKAQSSPGEL